MTDPSPPGLSRQASHGSRPADAGLRRATAERLLAPATVARLGRLRLRLARRVDGRFAGGHPAIGYGSSQDFVDYRQYVPGDDPRLLDPYAYARLGRRLVKLYTAEDTAAVRIVVDTSGSMAGAKHRAAAGAAAAIAAVAVAGGDRARVLLAGERTDAGPWYGGPAVLPAIEARLLGAPEPAGAADLTAALRRAASEGPRGPVVLVSDLFSNDWEGVLRLLGSARRDALLVHLLGREDLEPSVRGDVRLVDVETGAEVEVAVAEAALARHAALRDAWLADVQRVSGARGVAYTRLVDDQTVEALLAELARLGLLA